MPLVSYILGRFFKKAQKAQDHEQQDFISYDSTGGSMCKEGRFSILMLGSLVVCLVFCPLASEAFGAQVDRAALYRRIALLEATEVTSPTVLQSRYRTARERLLPILPPDPDVKLNPSGSIIVFNPVNFALWAKVLEPAELNGVTVYPVTVVEDPSTRNTIFYNGLAEPIGYLAPEQSYFPFTWLAEHHPECYTGKTDPNLLAWFEGVYDPARISITYWLLPFDQVDAFAEAQLSDIDYQSSALNRLLLDELLEPITNLTFYRIEQHTNGTVIGLCWPDSYTNRLDIFASSNLADRAWTLIATNLVTVGTNNMIWTDSATTGLVVRFYRAGNADLDSDNDMLPDAREIRLYGSCATNADTDGDGLSDGLEILHYHTDPVGIHNVMLPFSTSLEQTNSYALGQLDGQQGWSASSGVYVQNGFARTGDQAVEAKLGGETIFRGIASTDSVVTAEATFYWGPVADSPPATLPLSASALVSFDPAQGIMGYDGNGSGGGTWIAATNTRLSGQWVTLKIEQNFDTKTWKLYVNGTEKLNELGFKDASIGQLRGMHLRSGGSEHLFCDDVLIQTP
ncbi:MAG: thrombospondin type 3 repeat-containing protein [Kiritimatiellia bacterium]